MSIIREYLSELILAQLYGKQPNEIPEGVLVDELVQIARQHHINYLISGALLKLELPEGKKNELRYHVVNSMAKSRAQIAELKKLENRFEAANIQNLAMKGSFLKFIYPTPDMREMSDIDLLIPKAQFDQACELLVQMGYTLQDKSYHHDIYIKPPFMVVEVHKQMYDGSVDIDQEEYFADFSRAELKEQYQYTYCLKAEDFYIYMMSHFAKHFYKKGCGVRHLIDVHIYLQQFGITMDQEYLYQEFKKCKLVEFVKHMEELSAIWLNGKPGSIFYDQLFDYLLGSGIYGKDEYGIWNKYAENDKGKQNKFGLTVWYLFPPIKYLERYYPWLKKSPVLLPVAWIVRGVSGLIGKKGLFKRKMINEIDKEQIIIIKNIYKKMNLKFVNYKEI